MRRAHTTCNPVDACACSSTCTTKRSSRWQRVLALQQLTQLSTKRPWIRLCLCGMLLILMPFILVTHHAVARDATACNVIWRWPVTSPKVLAAFEPPEKNWLSGHRGLDLAAVEGDTLFAPANGTIAFVGTVGGKSVVSIRHESLTSTFEPAQSDLVTGTTVQRGEAFAVVAGESGHCSDECVHWGLKRSDADQHSQYVDPELRVTLTRIGLKPVPN